uniref:23S rRNA-intervening sequence protein n=1 Tax=Candidatus Kentrum sp. SD TaxID=2126332 RepID=A0A450YAS1_9GAMM|nr:MAG: 23S rRNA-intervening sequence protein [Candidatus Kentron sp. SD]VFK38627.1 MAG: 23S rRNA-intervening sequence protein [Candidatus Kentron sp. SD]
METQTPKAISDCHALLEWLIPQLDKFPRSRRFTLGERIETGVLAVLENLIEAAYSRGKMEPLKRANLKLNVVIHLWRLSFRLQVVNTKSYEHGARLMHELGKQIGGWSRQQAKGKENRS